MKKLAIVTTHPIQYYAPVFRLLHSNKNISIKVFYTLGKIEGANYDPGFGKSVSWDIPLLDGYEYFWMENTAKQPGTRNFNEIINPNLITQINQWEPDAVLVYGWAHNSHLKVLRYYKNKIPVYFRGDSTVLVTQNLISKTLKYVFLKWVYSNVDHAFFVGANNKQYFKTYGLKENQLTFAPHATDNKRFQEDRADEVKQLRFSLKISDEDILILFAGKFEPVKNVVLLLTAFLKVNKPNAHLLLVGNGIDEPLLKKQAAGNDNVHFLDFQNQTYMPVLYQAANLFCLPSLSESWGLSINEAMACGKAILASDKVGAATDLVKPGVNGAIFKVGSLSDLISKLNLLLQDGKSELERMGENSKKIIKNWSFENQVKMIESFMNKE